MSPETSEDTREAASPIRLAYVMSRFPKITETFILYEIVELERRGIPVEVFPLLREQQPVVNPEARPLVDRAHYQPLVSPAILAANAARIVGSPRSYASTWSEMLRGTWGNSNFFLGALAYFPMTVHFAREMQRLGVTHIHAHFANHPALVALAAHRMTGIPFSFTAHGSDIHVRQKFLDRKIEAASFVVTISDYNKRFMVEHCQGRHEEKIHVVRCGVDAEVFRPSSTRTEGARYRIVCVASYEEVKGHRYLLDACARLRERGVDFVCDLVGDGPLQQDVAARVESAGLGSHVVMHGTMPRERVAAMMREADVVVLPSVFTARGDREGIPVVLMEAMAVGLPVVASRISGIPELVLDGRTGLLVEPTDSDGLARALEKICQDPALARSMGEAGRRHVLKEFDLQKNTEQLIELFREVGRNPSGQARIPG